MALPVTLLLRNARMIFRLLPLIFRKKTYGLSAAGERINHDSGPICSFCKGKLREGTTEFLAPAAGEVIVIKDVPAFVCEPCGEAYYTAATSRKIDAIMQDGHKKKLCMRPLPAGEVSLNG